jgi:hypothetical protein
VGRVYDYAERVEDNMTTSYTNPCGSGDRWGLVTVTSDLPFALPSLYNLLRAGNVDGQYFSSSVAVSGKYIKLQFTEPVLIDEATWYQSAGAYSHGVWKWQGSNDGSSWTDIGSSFTFGGADVQVQTSLNGNTTKYSYYRLLGVSGNTNANPWLYKITFKIAATTETTSYLLPIGIGNRSSLITVTADVPMSYGLIGTLVTGTYDTGDCSLGSGTPAAGSYIKFDFANYSDGKACLKEAILCQDVASSHGIWKWQACDDNATWVDIGSSFTLGGSLVQVQTELNTNTYAFRYYRLLGISGNTNATPYVYEIHFKVDTSAPSFSDGASNPMMWIF